MNLSANFTLAELVASDYAQRHGINNMPTDPHVLGNLHVLAAGLERCRAILGQQPMIITSGYRSAAVNTAVGGSRRSAHMRGLAADFRVPGMNPRSVCMVLQEHPEVGFDQLIYEGTWTHIAFPENNRKPTGTVLTAIFKPGKPTAYIQGVA